MCESKDDVLVTAEEWAVISSGLQTAIAANFKLLAERTELRKQLAELLVLSAPQNQWVPVSWKMPDLDTPVWLYDPEVGTLFGMRASSTDGWGWVEGQHLDLCCQGGPGFAEISSTDCEPTHWMPLPSAPGDTAAPKNGISSLGDGWEAGGRLQALHLFAAEKIEKVLAESPAAQAPAQDASP